MQILASRTIKRTLAKLSYFSKSFGEDKDVRKCDISTEEKSFPVVNQARKLNFNFDIIDYRCEEELNCFFLRSYLLSG